MGGGERKFRSGAYVGGRVWEIRELLKTGRGGKKDVNLDGRVSVG
jgi:hypothetical protein